MIRFPTCLDLNLVNVQMPLPVRMCHDLDTFVENSRTANICEAVRTVTIVIQFLAKVSFCL